MARKNNKSIKNEKQTNLSNINVRNGGKVLKRQPQINSKTKNTNQIKCIKCSKLILNTSKNKSLVCVACLKKEALSSEKTAKQTVTRSKLTSTLTLQRSTQAREPTKKNKRSSNSNSKNVSKPNLTSPRVKPSSTANKRQTNSTSKRKIVDVKELAGNKKHALRAPASLKSTKLDKKEYLVAPIKKTEDKMSLRGRKRSYAQLASGVTMEDENPIKKRRNSEVKKEIRNSRNKKPTVKGSEWLNTIHSKKAVSPKQDKNKKNALKAPIKSKSPKTISPTNKRKLKSSELLPTKSIINTNSKRSVSQNSKSKSLTRKTPAKKPQKQTKLINETLKCASVKPSAAVNIPQKLRNNKITKKQGTIKQEKVSLKRNNTKLNKKDKLSNTLLGKTEIHLNNESEETKEGVLVVQELLHGILSSIHCTMDSDQISDKECVLEPVVSKNINSSININENITKHQEDINKPENDDTTKSQEDVLNSSSCNDSELPKIHVVEKTEENSISNPDTDSVIEIVKQNEKQISSESNNVNEGEGNALCESSMKSDNITAETNIAPVHKDITSSNNINDNITTGQEDINKLENDDTTKSQEDVLNSSSSCNASEPPKSPVVGKVEVNSISNPDTNSFIEHMKQNEKQISSESNNLVYNSINEVKGNVSCESSLKSDNVTAETNISPVNKDINSSININKNITRHQEDINKLESDDTTKSQEDVLNSSSYCNASEPPKSPVVEKVVENSISNPDIDFVIEHVKQNEKQISSASNNPTYNSVNEVKGIDSCESSLKSDNVTAETNISPNLKNASIQNLLIKEVSSENSTTFSKETCEANKDGSKNISESSMNGTKYSKHNETLFKDPSDGISDSSVVYVEQNRNAKEPIQNKSNITDTPIIESVSCETNCLNEIDVQNNLLQNNIESCENNSNKSTDEIDVHRTDSLEDVNQGSVSNSVNKQDSVQEGLDIGPHQGICKKLEKGNEYEIVKTSINTLKEQYNVKEGGGILVSAEDKSCLKDQKHLEEHMFGNSCFAQGNGKELEDEHFIKEKLSNSSDQDCKLANVGNPTEQISNTVSIHNEAQVEESSNVAITTSINNDNNKIKEEAKNLEGPADQNKFVEMNQLNESSIKNVQNILGETVTSDEKSSNIKKNIAVVDSTTNKINSSVDNIVLEDNAFETSKNKHTELNSTLVYQNDVSNNNQNISKTLHEKCSNKDNSLNLVENSLNNTIVDKHINEHQEVNVNSNQISCEEKQQTYDTTEQIMFESSEFEQDKKNKQLHSITEKQSNEILSSENTNVSLNTCENEHVENKLEIHSSLSNVENSVNTNKEDTPAVVCESDTKNYTCDEFEKDLSVLKDTSTLNKMTVNEEIQNNVNLVKDNSSLNYSQKVPSNNNINKNKCDHENVSEVTEQTLSKSTEHDEQSVVSDKPDGSQVSETGYGDIKNQTKFVESSTEEVLVTGEEMEDNISISSFSEKMESKVLQSALTTQEIKLQSQTKEIQPDSNIQEKTEFSKTMFEKEKSHQENKVTQCKIEDTCQLNSSTKDNRQFESGLKVKQSLAIIKESEKHDEVRVLNIGDAEECKIVLKPELIAVEKEVRENDTLDLLNQNNVNNIVTKENTTDSVCEETAAIVTHAIVKHEDVNQTTSKQLQLDNNDQSENNTSNVHVTELTYLETNESDTHKDEEMLVDDETTVENNHENNDCRTSSVENQSILPLSSTNEDMNNTSKNRIDVDSDNCQTDQASSKMEDFTNDAISVDCIEGENMQCNSETHSSNRMSFDEDNATMDIDPDDTAVEVDLCSPAFETKLGSELNMEVS